MKQKKSIWLKIVLGIVIVVFCFVPMINMPYDVIVHKQVSEEYTTVEPYTVQEEVQEPYEEMVPIYMVQPPETEARLRYLRVTKYRTVIKDVTKYGEVTKTRLVTRPIVETRTRRVSILRYLLR